jgi:hypothetical protein
VNEGQDIANRIVTTRGEFSWHVLGNREAAVDAIRNNKVYGALVLPADLTIRIEGLLVTAGKTPPPVMEYLRNSGGGYFAVTTADAEADSVVKVVSSSVSEGLIAQFNSSQTKIEPNDASSVGNPVLLARTNIIRVSSKGGLGQTPLWVAIALVLAGLVGAGASHHWTRFLSGEEDLEVLGAPRARPRTERTPSERWAADVVVASGCAFAAALGVVAMAVVLGMQTGPLVPFLLFSLLSILAVTLATVLLVTAFGRIGVFTAVLLAVVLGVSASAGVYPTQAMPGFFRVVGAWLPMRHVVDGLRSLFFFGGRSAAGLRSALVVLSAYALIGLVGGWALGQWETRRLASPSPVPPGDEPEDGSEEQEPEEREELPVDKVTSSRRGSR